MDFQVIVPALLVSLSHKERRMREAALECVTVMARLSQAKKPESIYGFDIVYGTSSGALAFCFWRFLLMNSQCSSALAVP